MKEAIKIFGLAFLVTLAIIAQSSHILEFWGVNPNLILILVFLPLVLEKEFSKALTLIFIILVLAIIFLPYWPKEILILTGLVLVGLFLRKFLTGREFWDFIILILFGTFGFYLINNFFYFPQKFLIIVAELVYNILLGSFLFFVFSFYEKKETRIKS